MGREPFYWYRYLLAIRSPDAASGGASGGEQAFRDAGWMVLDLDDGSIGPQRHPRGAYQFVTLDTARAAFPTARWWSVDHPVRSVGRAHGFLNFEWWTDDRTQRATDIGNWFGRSCGYLVDLTEGTVYNAVVRRRWPLREVLERHGFDDGDFFLSHQPVHLEPARQILTTALTAAGIEPEFITYGTHHNPLLVQSHNFAAVEGRFVDLWGWNQALMNDPGFRRHVLNDPTSGQP